MRPFTMLLCVLAVFLAAGLVVGATTELLSPAHLACASLALGMAVSYGVRDASLKATDALADDAGTKNGTGIDLGNALTADGARLAGCELLLSAPALNATQLPNTTTMTYSIQSSATSNFAATTTIGGNLIVQTGNAGAAAATARLKLPSDCARYVRAVAVGADVGNVNLGNCAASSMTLELLF